MSIINIKKTNNKELAEYIKTTKKSIEQLLNKYVNMNYDELNENKQIKDLKIRAYTITNIYESVKWNNKKIIMNKTVASRIKTIPKRGEIWTCQLGNNIGSEENKARPVIIVQNNTGNVNSPTTIIIPISNRQKKIAVHIELRKNDYILEKGEKTNITGTVLCEQIRVVSKVRLGRHIATLKNEFIELLVPKLNFSLGL